MANLFADLPVPAGVGVGASVDTSSHGRIRTITVQGTMNGTITIEISQDNTNFFPVASFTGPKKKTVEVAAAYMRVRRSGNTLGTPNVDVASDDSGGDYSQLVAPAGDGAGAAVDVSAFGTFNTIVVSGTFTGTVHIEISEDNNDWTVLKSVTNASMFSREFVAQYMRVRRAGTTLVPGPAGTPTIYVGAINDYGGGSAGYTNPLILQTGDGTVTAPAAYASGAIGHGVDGGVGTADVAVDPAGSGLAMGWVDSYAGGTARVKATGQGTFAHGNVSLSGAHTAEIEAGVDGSQAFGAAYGIGANASIKTAAGGEGALAFGWAGANNATADIESSGWGSLAAGYVYGGGGDAGLIQAGFDGCIAFGGTWGGTIRADNSPCFALGYAYGQGVIYAHGNGSMALGFAHGAGSEIETSSFGNIAAGYVKTAGTIVSDGKGSLARGYAYGGGTIEATGAGTTAFGYVGPSAGMYSDGRGSFIAGYANNGGQIAANSGSSVLGASYGAGSSIECDYRGCVVAGEAMYGGEMITFGNGGFIQGHCEIDGLISINGEGAMARGFCTGNNSQVTAAEDGCFASGRAASNGDMLAFGYGGHCMGEVIEGAKISTATGSHGCLAGGYANDGAALIYSRGHGSFAWGHSAFDGDGSAGIIARGNGCLAFGDQSGGSNDSNAQIYAYGDGSIALGRAYNNVASSANYSSIYATGDGALAQGFANEVGTILASGGGAHAGGYVSSSLILAGGEIPAAIEATHAGSFAHGWAKRTITAGAKAYMRAINEGAWVGGYAFGYDAATYPARLEAQNEGSMAHGYVRDAYLLAQQDGAHAFGRVLAGGEIAASGLGSFATGNCTGGKIIASGTGALASGFANGATYDVVASGDGSFAVGLAAAADVRAAASNSMQFGEGTNSVANTVQIGAAGIRFKQTTGAPGAPQNGDVWVDNNYVYIRSNGVSCKCVNASM